MSEKKQADQFAKAAPPLNEAELDAVNGLFQAYIFRRSRTGELWTTCCRKHVALKSPWSHDEKMVMIEPHQREQKNRWDEPVKPTVRCPYCGKPVIVKELGRTGTRKNLSSYRRAVVLRWYRGALWARAYDCGKHYQSGKYELTGAPSRKLVGVYRFRHGLAEGTTRPWWHDGQFYTLQRQDGPIVKGKWNIHGPYNANAEYGTGYDILGLDEIQKSPFRYCMAKEYEKHHSCFMEFLTACCFYPHQIEMLMKAGMDSVVYDLAGRGVKNAMAIDWTQEDPTKAFGLNKQELKVFLNTKRNIDTVALYKQLKRRVPMEEAADWVERCADVRGTVHEAKAWHLPPEKLFRYLAKAQSGRMGNPLGTWRDYLTAAQALGYPLHRENVLLPKDLGAAHDSATAKHRNKLERERKQRQQKKDRLRAMAYAKRKTELEKKYAFSMDGYVIRIPASGEEIIQEGKALQHCVAGYADRHENGAVTILFMRKEKQTDKPWLTIEMRGNTLMQIHGYKNEGLYSAKGRFAPDPREVYASFLDTWLDWLKKGSKRDKDGKPVLPKGKKKKEVKIA